MVPQATHCPGRRSDVEDHSTTTPVSRADTAEEDSSEKKAEKPGETLVMFYNYFPDTNITWIR